MRIGHYQCICPEDNFEANLETLRRGLRLAADAGLEILSFPECSLTGYYRDEERARGHAFPADSREIRTVLSVASDFDMTVIAGFNELRGDDLFNTAAVIESGRLVGTYSKLFPIFDLYTPGNELPVFNRKGFPFGIVICADGSYIEPCRILALKGARLVFAPHHNFVDDPLDHCLAARRQHTGRAVENGIYYLRGNNVMPPGDYGKLVNGVPYFGYGDSYLIDPTGERVAGAGLHEETLMIYNLDPQRYVRPPGRKSRSLISAERLLKALQAEIRRQAAGDPA
ncbi:carbon-nitrogen hydrolase family protein [Verrucomicrobiota bacterium]